MRCNPSYWLLGLVPIAMLSWVAVELERDGIERDLGRRMQQALARNGFAWAAPIFSGRDATLTGKALDDTDPARAIAAARDVWGVRTADARIGLVETVDRYTWTATSRGDGRIVLAGFAPSEESRRTLVSAAKSNFSGADIVDEMRLARGAPDRDAWMSGAEFGLKQLSHLKRGVATLEQLDISLTGEAASSPSYKAVRAALADERPAGVGLGVEDIKPPRLDQYAWSAKYAGGDVTITGFAPSDAVRGDLERKAKSSFRNAKISDRAEIADGAPDGFAAAAATTLEQLALLKSGAADFNGKEITFTGQAADEAAALAVRKTLRSVIPQSYKLIDQIGFPKTSPPAPQGYVMAIANDGTALEVSGMVPSEASRTALVDAVRARFPGKTVADKLAVAQGAPEGWQQCIVAGLAALPRLKSGKAQLIDRKLTVVGATDDYAVAEAVPIDVKAAAGQTCDAQTNIQFSGKAPTDLSWKAVRGADRRLVLQGETPDASSRVRLAEAAQTLFPGVNVSDQMIIAGSSSQVWLPVALRGLEQLAKLNQGEATLVGQELTVSGIAVNEDVASAVRSAVASGMPQGFTGREKVTVMSAVEREADQCEGLMRATTERGVINFARAAADLTQDSTDTLKELAEIANECPKFRIEIEGHTDAEGTDERNQRLSDRRARAVADFLVGVGVSSSRLNAVGYGASRPIADNDTEEGRARNRRIEFAVKVN
ncbi:MAG: OmpA family protein [Hyphomicrobium sp.]